MSKKKRSPIKVPKSVRGVVEKAIANGWDVEWTRKGHLKFTHPSGAIAFHSGTPGEYRANKNFESQLRRAVRQQEGSQ